MKNALGTALHGLTSAASSALSQARSMSGNTNNPDLKLYLRLNDNDFQDLMQKFGPDQTAQFIRRMEALRLKDE